MNCKNIDTPEYINQYKPARTYIPQLCKNTGCSPEDLPEVMNDREKLRERVRISLLAA